jgi:drug/metabolite transporter (DMT)-like permease
MLAIVSLDPRIVATPKPGDRQMNNPLVLTVIVALAWSSAPLLGRQSTIGAMPMATLVAIGTAFVALPLLIMQDWGQVSLQQYKLNLGIGLANGIGLLAFYALVDGAIKGRWDLAQYGTVCYVLVPVIMAVVGKAWYGDDWTTNKTIMLLLASGAIYFGNK